MPVLHELLGWPGRWLVVLTFATAAVSVALSVLGRPLKTCATPKGILALELAWNQATANRILNDWGGARIGAAKAQTLVDFLFLCLYPPAIALACSLLASSLGGSGAVWQWVAWLALAMAPLDAVENAAILRMLWRHTEAPIPQIASVAATLKFAILGVALAFLVLGGAVRLWRLP